jgi:hypothetical protein
MAGHNFRPQLIRAPNKIIKWQANIFLYFEPWALQVASSNGVPNEDRNYFTQQK